MALCCLLSAKVRKAKVSDILAASTFCLRNGLPMSSECFAREFVPERAAEGRTRPTLRRRAASSSACRGVSGGGAGGRRCNTCAEIKGVFGAGHGESDCLELYKCLPVLLCTDGVIPALSRRAATDHASSWIIPRIHSHPAPIFTRTFISFAGREAVVLN